MKELDLPKWDELFEELWKERSTLWATPPSKEFSMLSYDAAKDIALRVMQNALVPKEREIKRLDPSHIHIPVDAYFKLKETHKYLPSDDPTARCLGLVDTNTGVVFYSYVEEVSNACIGPSIINLAGLHLVKE